MITQDELFEIMKFADEYFPENYGYTAYGDDGKKEYLLFRNREESFNKYNSILNIPYRW
jgi:hypothetical protein